MNVAPVALVTGGAGGIGAAACLSLAERGFDLAVADVEAALHGARLEGDRLLLEVDVRSTPSVERVVEQAVERFGRLDVVVNAAGIIDPSPSATLTDKRWRRLVEVHLDGTMRCCRGAFPALARSPQAAIVNVSSIAARLGTPGRLSYSAAKAGVEALTRTLAVEWAVHGVRVNAVAPGYVRTGPTVDAIARRVVDPEALERRIPLGRLAEPSEVAAVVAFLADREASYVTGQIVVVDGGLSVEGRW